MKILYLPGYHHNDLLTLHGIHQEHELPQSLIIYIYIYIYIYNIYIYIYI